MEPWRRLEIGEPPLKDTSAQNYGRPNSSFKDTRAAKSLVYGRENVLESEKQYSATCLPPLFTPIYMVCRATRKNRGECYRTRRRLHGLTERRFAARAVTRVPHVFGLNARLHAFSSSDKDLIDLRTQVMPEPG